MKKNNFLLFILVVFIMLSSASCNNKSYEQKDYKVELNELNDLSIETLLTNISILHNEEIPIGTIILEYKAVGEQIVSTENSVYSISNIDSFEGNINANPKTIINSIKITQTLHKNF